MYGTVHGDQSVVFYYKIFLTQQQYKHDSVFSIDVVDRNMYVNSG